MNKQIITRTNYVLVGSDFSAQEPRLLSAYSGDENMIGAFKAGKDLYATIGIGAFNNTYWDNMEHHEDGTPYPEGKKRRSQCKKLLLGITYGRGTASIAEQLGCTKDEAQKIIDNFYKGFPKVKTFTEESEKFAIEHGYVEDFYGRRRRLPDIQLPKYEVKQSKFSNIEFNPLLGANNNNTNNVLINKYLKALEKCKYKKEIDDLKAKADKDGIYIKDNSGFIAQAQRQVVNSRIQGGAATMTKKAMIAVYNDEIMKQLDFHLLICVHDELIGECPEVNAKEASERLSYLMRSCVPELSVPFKCDPTIEKHWYEEEYEIMINDEYSKLLDDMTKEEAFKTICKNHIESLPDKLKDYIKEK